MLSIFRLFLFAQFVGSILCTEAFVGRNRENISILVTSARITYHVTFRATLHKWGQSRLWWRAKLIFFHTVMLGTYITKRTWEWIKNEFRIAFFGLLYPVWSWIAPIIYVLGIYFALTCTAIVDGVRIISWSCKGVVKVSYNNLA